jgi:hypothetical protein
MARGITSFHAYGKEYGPWGMKYKCLYCHYFFVGQQRFPGNALARHSKSVGLIKKHVEDMHPERLAGTVLTAELLTEALIREARRRGWIDESLLRSAIPDASNDYAGEIGVAAARERCAEIIKSRSK